MTKSIRILLADDHVLLRAGLRVLIQTLEGLEVIAEAGNGREALRLVKEHNPNVVLMDIMMPELNGLDATARITTKFPSVRVIMLSMSAGEQYVLPALRAGAAGYLLKNVETAELEQAIRKVAQGETYLCSAVVRQVVTAFREKADADKTSLERLTPRQREILHMVVEGNSTKEIALKLNLSSRTVETHRTQLMEALHLHDCAGMVRYAIRMGLISADD